MTFNVTQENGMAVTVLDCVLAERAQSQGLDSQWYPQSTWSPILQSIQYLGISGVRPRPE